MWVSLRNILYIKFILFKENHKEVWWCNPMRLIHIGNYGLQNMHVPYSCPPLLVSLRKPHLRRLVLDFQLRCGSLHSFDSLLIVSLIRKTFYKLEKKCTTKVPHLCSIEFTIFTIQICWLSYCVNMFCMLLFLHFPTSLIFFIDSFMNSLIPLDLCFLMSSFSLYALCFLRLLLRFNVTYV